MTGNNEYPVNVGDWMGSILGDVVIHSTGTVPWIKIDDAGATAGRHVTLASNASGDTITGYPGRITLAGFAPARVVILGGSGDDVFTMLGRIPGLRIDAGTGHDTLDDSNYLTDVVVDLLAGTATGIDRGIAGFEKVIEPTRKK